MEIQNCKKLTSVTQQNKCSLIASICNQLKYHLFIVLFEEMDLVVKSFGVSQCLCSKCTGSTSRLLSVKSFILLLEQHTRGILNEEFFPKRFDTFGPSFRPVRNRGKVHSSFPTSLLTMIKAATSWCLVAIPHSIDSLLLDRKRNLS
jgi:hypothetical protein